MSYLCDKKNQQQNYFQIENDFEIKVYLILKCYVINF